MRNGKVHSEIMEISAKVLMTHQMRLNTVVCLFNPLFKCLFCPFVGVLTIPPLPAFQATKWPPHSKPWQKNSSNTPHSTAWNPDSPFNKFMKHLLALLKTEIFALILWHSQVWEHYHWICVQDFPAGISWMSVPENPKGSCWHFLNLFIVMGSLLWKLSKD